MSLPAIGPTRYSLPRTVVTNDDLMREHPNWDMGRVARRTGVTSRHIAEPDETALSLAVDAATALLEDIGLEPTELGGVVVCTQTPDYRLPANAPLAHALLGMSPAALSLDLSLACSGFPYSVAVAGGLLPAAGDAPILVLTGDTYSRLIAPEDRSTRSVFGDGAAATLVVSAASPRAGHLDVMDATFGTNGHDAARFIVSGGGAAEGFASEQSIAMDGVGMLAFVRDAVPSTVTRLLERNGLAVQDIDLFIFHQASRLALEALGSDLGIAPDRLYLDMAETGNLVSASIPVCLRRAEVAGRLQSGMRVVLAGFGVGLSWGALLATVK